MAFGKATLHRQRICRVQRVVGAEEPIVELGFGCVPLKRANPARRGQKSSHSVTPQKLLFVCSRNRIRSLTAEKYLAGLAGYEVKSAGTQPGARIVVTAGHLGWADLIFVMEKSHLSRLRLKFRDELEGKVLITLNIADEYEFMQPELLEELRARLSPHVSFLDRSEACGDP